MLRGCSWRFGWMGCYSGDNILLGRSRLVTLELLVFCPRTRIVAGRRYAGTLAVNSIPSAFITAIVVFNVGLPCSLSDR